jgi:hypothetical protein
MGLLAYESAIRRDYPVVMGTLYLFTLIGLVVKLVGDLCYVWVIRASNSKAWRNEHDDPRHCLHPFHFAEPSHLAALPCRPNRLLEPGDLFHSLHRQPGRRTGLQRQAACGQLRGKLMFPMLKDYSDKHFGGDFDSPADYLDPFIEQQFRKDGNWVIYPLNRYGYNTLNYFAKRAQSGGPFLGELAGHR